MVHPRGLATFVFTRINHPGNDVTVPDSPSHKEKILFSNFVSSVLLFLYLSSLAFFGSGIFWSVLVYFQIFYNIYYTCCKYRHEQNYFWLYSTQHENFYSLEIWISQLFKVGPFIHRKRLTRGVRLVSDADFFVTLQVKRGFQTMKKKIVFWAIVKI